MTSTVSTDDAGRYRFGAVVDRRPRLLVRADGYAATVRTPTLPATTRTRFDVALERPGRITGRVIDHRGR